VGAAVEAGAEAEGTAPSAGGACSADDDRQAAGLVWEVWAGRGLVVEDCSDVRTSPLASTSDFLLAGGFAAALGSDDELVADAGGAAAALDAVHMKADGQRTALH